MRNWRKMTWVLIGWATLILIWAIAGGANSADRCTQLGDHAAKSGCQAGTGVGVALILLIGFFGFVFLSLIWFMTRPKDRPSASHPPAGWYQHPEGGRRWWDGQRWTEHVPNP